ncbi:hypothetical protein G9A89_019250 [Geosiphon pyriformis]|nr:hypothetical protein G9A89_019250 [Geosiphon pyriformis]
MLSEENKSRLAFIYAKYSASIAYSVSFGGASWTKIVGGSFFSPFIAHNDLTYSGSSSEMKPPLPVVNKLELYLVNIESSLTSLMEQINKLTKRSTINITSADAFTSNITLIFGQLPFQSKQKKAELLRTYSNYFKKFKLQSLIPLEFQLLPSPPDFGTASPWKITALEKKDQEFNYQNPIAENLEVETPNIQTQQTLNNPNSELINQQNLSPEIVINQQPIDPIAEQLQQPPIPPQ